MTLDMFYQSFSLWNESKGLVKVAFVYVLRNVYTVRQTLNKNSDGDKSIFARIFHSLTFLVNFHIQEITC